MTAPTSIAAVVFDLDDTLYPECEFVFSGFAAVADASQPILGDPAQTTARMRQLFYTGYRNRVFNTLLGERGLPQDQEFVGRMREIYHTHTPTISLCHDADAALDRLRGRYRLGLISDGPAAMQANKVAALGLRSRLDAIILTEQLGQGFAKPNPRAFEDIAGQLHAAPQRCVYVADNAAKDFVGPNSLGWTTVQIVRPEGVYRDQPAAAAGTPHYQIETLHSLDALLE